MVFLIDTGVSEVDWEAHASRHASDGADPITPSMIDAASMEYAKKIGNPHNLLDNSDFRNPVNRKGQASYKGAGYGIDEWECTSNNWMVSVEDGCIKVSDNPDSSSTSTSMLRQTLAVDASIRGKTVTLAAKLKGDGMVRLNINNTGVGAYAGSDDWYIKTVTGTIPSDADTFFVALQSRNMETYYCEWVALYEGEYTAETLPEYQPKGYNVELLNCGGITADYVGAIATASKPYGSYTGNGDAATRKIDTGVISDQNSVVLIRKSGGTSFAIVTSAGYIGKDSSDVVCGAGASFGGVSGLITLMSAADMFNTNGVTYKWYCL